MSMSYKFIIIAIFLNSCASSAKITFKKEGEIVKLDNDFSSLGYMGKVDVLISEKEFISRFLHIPQIEPEEYIIIVDAQSASGTIEIPDTKPLNINAIPIHLHRYFDLLLRAHRAFLKRDVEVAEQILKNLDNSFDVTYGSLVLAGNIAIFKGDKGKAATLFKKAKTIYKDSPALTNLIKG